MTLGSGPELTLTLYEVRYVCAGKPGCRQVWAPSERSASRVLRDHPSKFGLDHETVVVRSVKPLRSRPVGKAA